MKRFLVDRLIRPVYRALMRRMAIRQNVVYCRDLNVGRRSTIMAPGRLEIGPRVKIGMDTWIAVNGVIEDGVQISSYVGIVGKNDHDLSTPGQRPFDAPWVFDGTMPMDERHAIHIERDAWIGYNATILSGLRIGRGALVAASAVVTKDVAPYAIVAGNPARQVGSLFTPEQIAEHERVLAARDAARAQE